MAKFKETPAGPAVKVEKAEKILENLVEKYSQQGIQFSLTAKERESIIESAAKKQNVGTQVQWLLVKTIAKKDAGLATELYVKIYEKKHGAVPDEITKKAVGVAGEKGGLKGFFEARDYLKSLGGGLAAGKGAELGGAPTKADKTEEKGGKTKVELLGELKKINDDIMRMADIIPKAEMVTVIEIGELVKKLEKDPGNADLKNQIQEQEALMKDIAKEKKTLQIKMRERTSLVKELGLEKLYDKKYRYGLAGLEVNLGQKSKSELAEGTSTAYQEIQEHAAFVKKEVDKVLKEAKA